MSDYENHTYFMGLKRALEECLLMHPCIADSTRFLIGHTESIICVSVVPPEIVWGVFDAESALCGAVSCP
jgi:hypothetical protein